MPRSLVRWVARAALVRVTALATAAVLAGLASACGADLGPEVPQPGACRGGYVGLTFDDGPKRTPARPARGPREGGPAGDPVLQGQQRVGSTRARSRRT